METASTIPELKKTENLDRYFALCGRRCYLIGTQDGQFPDIGWHTHQEMGGIWTHPIKIADGFWVGVDLPDEEREGYNPMRRAWLEKSDEFILGDGGAWCEHRYNDPYVQTNWDILPRLKAVRREWVPKDEPAVGIDITLTSKDPSLREVQLNFLIRFEILPVWCSGWPDPIHVEAEFDRETGLVVAHGVTNNDLPFDHGMWSAALGCNVAPKRVAIGEQLWGRERTTGKGVSALLKFPLALDPSAHVRLVLAGDHTGEQGAVDTVNRVLGHGDESLKKKVRWYRQVANEQTSVDTPDELLNDGFHWSKMNLEWLTQTSPILGTGVYAGFQDYAQYFGGDTEASIGGMLAAGFHDESISALRMIGEMAAKQGGRVPHAFVSNGAVYDPGQDGEVPYFAYVVWNAYLWTGDEQFLKDMYPIIQQGMWGYLQTTLTDEGHYLMDYEDRPGSAVDRFAPAMHTNGFKCLARIATRLGDTETAEKAAAEAERLRQQVETFYWVEKEGTYAGRLGPDDKPVPPEGPRTWALTGHGTNIGIALAKAGRKDRIDRAYAVIKEPEFNLKYGICLWPTEPGAVGALMPYTTGCAAIGAMNYGRHEQGLELLRGSARTVGHIMPGALPETIWADGNADRFHTHVSSHWEFLQLWSAATYLEALISGLLHPQPDAVRGNLTLRPYLPKGWPYAEVKNLKVGGTRLNIRTDKDGTKVTHVDGPKLDVEVKELSGEWPLD